MPKEVIRSKYDDPNGQLFHAEVRWNRSLYVQVAATWQATGVGQHLHPCESVLKPGNWAANDLAPTVGSVCGGEHCPPAGKFVDLDRTGINSLIRALRKARDQAFGADA